MLLLSLSFSLPIDHPTCLPLREDSRLHVYIVCASIPCPNVRREAFRTSNQMDSQVAEFLSNPNKGFRYSAATYFIDIVVQSWGQEVSIYNHNDYCKGNQMSTCNSMPC